MSDMSELSQEEIQKRRLLDKLNQNSLIYGEQGMTQEEMQGLLYTENSITLNNTSTTLYREKLKNMMMVDVVTARSLKDDYPEIVKEAENEAKTLADTAKLSGMKKVLKDITGKKRMAAQKKLDEINEKKSRLAAEKKREYDAKAAPLSEQRAAMMQNIERERDAQTEEFEKRSFQKRIDAVNSSINGEDYVSNQYALEKGSEYERRSWMIQEVFLERKALNAYNPLTKQVIQKSFAADRLIRDMSRFAMKLDLDGTAEQQNTDLTRDRLVETANDLHVFADKIYVCTEGRHASAEYDEDGNPVPLPDEEKKNAFKDCHKRLQEKMPEVEKIKEIHPRIFKPHPDMDDLMDAYGDMKKVYNTAQVCSYICDGLLSGGAFEKISTEDRVTFAKTYTSLKGMKQYLEDMGRLCDDYSKWLNNPVGDPPEINGNEYSNYQRHTEFNKKRAWDRINGIKEKMIRGGMDGK